MAEQTNSVVRTFDNRQIPAAGVYDIDPAHTAVEFVGRHLMITKVRGRFPDVRGRITIAEAPEDSHVEVEIGAGSVSTGNDDRDAHLKSADFLHVEKFPTLSFKSTDIKVAGDGELKVQGDLTIRGVTRKVTFAVEGPTPPTKDPWGNTRLAASATTKINRKDFGLIWNAALETGGILVGDEVTITLDVEFVKA